MYSNLRSFNYIKQIIILPADICLEITFGIYLKNMSGNYFQGQPFLIKKADETTGIPLLSIR